jgi:hypothetical protein
MKNTKIAKIIQKLLKCESYFVDECKWYTTFRGERAELTVYKKPKFQFDLRYISGDDEHRPTICIGTPFATIFVYVGVTPKEEYHDERHGIGFSIFVDYLTIYFGKSYKMWDIPFLSYNHKYTIKSTVDDEVFYDSRKEQSWDEEFRLMDERAVSYPYKYTLKSGEVQERIASVIKEYRIWGRKWFPFLTRERNSIWVTFNEEVGERTGSWKGGVTGCGYDLKDGETALECLRRMEKERKFE